MNTSRANFLPPFRHSLGEEEIEEVVDTLRSDWITRGPKTQLFEKEFGEYIGCKHAIAVSSCTAAMHLALVGNDIGAGDEVILSPYTFAATSEVAIYSRSKPVFCDIDPVTFNIDPDKIESHITDKTKAIMPVHFAGHPCDLSKILEIAKRYDLKIIEDAAHALPAMYNGDMIGTIGDATCFSFYATKNLSTAEGGMIATNDDDLAERMRVLSLHGISKDAWKRYSSEGSWYYEIEAAGFKYNFTDIQASIGIHQLRKLDAMQKRREELVAIYQEELAGIDEISLPVIKGDVKHAWHLFPLLIRPEMLRIARNEFIEELKKRNIGTSVHFIPLHLHPFYQNVFHTKKGDYPNAEHVFEREISIPLYPQMSDDDCMDVVGAIKAVINAYRR